MISNVLFEANKSRETLKNNLKMHQIFLLELEENKCKNQNLKLKKKKENSATAIYTW